MNSQQPLVGTWESAMEMQPPHPPPPLRKKKSMRDRLRVLRPRSSDQEAFDCQQIERPIRTAAPYVPKHAALDFSRVPVNPRNREGTSLRGSISSGSTKDAEGRQALMGDAANKLWPIADHPAEDQKELRHRHQNPAPSNYRLNTAASCPSERQTRPTTPDLQIRSGDSPSPASTEYSLSPYNPDLVSPLSATSPQISNRSPALDDIAFLSPVTPRKTHTPRREPGALENQQDAVTELSRKQRRRATTFSSPTSLEEKLFSDYQLFLSQATQRDQWQQEQMWHKLATPDGQVVYTTNATLNDDDPRWKRSTIPQPTSQSQNKRLLSRDGRQETSLGASVYITSDLREKPGDDHWRGGRRLGKRISQYFRPTRESNVW